MRFFAVLAALALATASPGSAAVRVTVKEVGPDVVATLRGSLNMAGLTSGGIFGGVPVVWGEFGVISFGGPATAYSTNSRTWGNGPLINASAISGDAFVIQDDIFGVPTDYVSGAPLSASMTFANQTLGSMGLFTGLYVYHLPNDRVTLDIGGLGTGAVPEPASWAMLLTGFAMVGAALRRRKSALVV